MTAIIPTVFGVALIVLGISGYFGAASTSTTALIPAFFGLALCAIAVAASNGRLGKRAMYGVAAIAVIGVLGSLRALLDILALITGGTTMMATMAVVSQGLMLTLCAILLLLWAKSMAQLRRQQPRSFKSSG